MPILLCYVALSAYTSSLQELYEINPLWKSFFEESEKEGDYSFFFDRESWSVYYKKHLWYPADMDHHKKCDCGMSYFFFFELD